MKKPFPEHTKYARFKFIQRLSSFLFAILCGTGIFLAIPPHALGADVHGNTNITNLDTKYFLNTNDSIQINQTNPFNMGINQYLYNLTVEPSTEWNSDEHNAYSTTPVNLDNCQFENVFFGLTFDSDNLAKPIYENACMGMDCKNGFREVYPLQPHWVFKINTPSDVTQAEIKNFGNCPISVTASQKESLDLWSGFKSFGDPFVTDKRKPDGTLEDQDMNDELIPIDSLGHHVLKKIYYYETGGKITALGALNTISASKFPALGGGVWGDIMIMPDTIRAPHWHMTEAESGFCYQGYGKVGAIVDKDTFPSSDGSGYANDRLVEEIFIHPNEIFMFPTGAQHYLRNIGSEPFKCILFLRHGVPTNPKILSAITLQNVLGQTPLGVSAAFTNPKNPSLNLTGFIDMGQVDAYNNAASISNYQNEAFKPSQDYAGITVKSADADCRPESWMTCVPAICPLKDLPEADRCANVTNGGPYKSQTP
ncbi:MAG: hypothetical protein F6K37_36380 [Moorea sp. SIO4E2]|uniref:cupin domain-containing protein n=1 Tax=Moorena sp. SIO4E2 TaxID=2607826 RepID=UPI0013BA558B|nr:cupin domain-containing protein [Moorena sp. SIO4E2]NEQ11186.1 hypothetical protein [Moorena sp. SIO4E2]